LPEKVYNSLEAFGRYRVFITLRFNYGGEVVLRLVSIDMVLVFKDWLIRQKYHPDSLVVIDSSTGRHIYLQLKSQRRSIQTLAGPSGAAHLFLQMIRLYITLLWQQFPTY
jgi:hypothetical protein